MKKNVFLRKRANISMLIWLGNVLFWTVITSFVMKERPLPGWFWILFLFAYAIQAVPYWLFLNRNFGDQRRGSIALIMSMPFLILMGFWVCLVIVDMFAASQLKT